VENDYFGPNNKIFVFEKTDGHRIEPGIFGTTLRVSGG
jgi:hypothetical protein